MTVGHRDVDLEREAAARGPGGAEQPGRERPLLRPHDPRGQVEQPGELRQIQLSGGDVRRAGEHGDGRSRRSGEVAGERHARQFHRVPLEEPREAIDVVGLEFPHDARVVDGDGPDEIVVLAGGLVPAPRVGRDPMQLLRRRLHVPSLPATLPLGTKGRPEPRPEPRPGFLDVTLGTYSPHADERRARRAVVEGRPRGDGPPAQSVGASLEGLPVLVGGGARDRRVGPSSHRPQRRGPLDSHSDPGMARGSSAHP